MITLGIIGAVAVVTLPVLINNVQDKMFRAKWKKAFATISLAHKMAQEEGIISKYDSAHSGEVYYAVFKNLNTSDWCVKADMLPVEDDSKSCEKMKINPRVTYTASSLSGDKSFVQGYEGRSGRAILPDGSYIYAFWPMWDAPSMSVDVNGSRRPNVVGRDIFVLYLREDGTFAAGAQSNKLVGWGWGYFTQSPSGGCSKDESSPASGYYDFGRWSGAGCSTEYLMR